jgi:hypothetical protein
MQLQAAQRGHSFSRMVSGGQVSMSQAIDRQETPPQRALRQYDLERHSSSHLDTFSGTRLIQRNQRRAGTTGAGTSARQPVSDQELLAVLAQFNQSGTAQSGQSATVTLYHVDSGGMVLQGAQRFLGGQHPSRGNLRMPNEFWLTTNVEARTGFRGGRGLNRIVAITLDRRFYDFLMATAVHQRQANAPNPRLQGLINVNPPVPSPRLNYEGGGQGVRLPTGELNIAIYHTPDEPELRRLFELSVRRIEHLTFDPRRPSGQRLVREAQPYPQLPPGPAQATPGVEAAAAPAGGHPRGRSRRFRGGVGPALVVGALSLGAAAHPQDANAAAGSSVSATASVRGRATAAPSVEELAAGEARPHARSVPPAAAETAAAGRPTPSAPAGGRPPAGQARQDEPVRQSGAAAPGAARSGVAGQIAGGLALTALNLAIALLGSHVEGRRMERQSLANLEQALAAFQPTLDRYISSQRDLIEALRAGSPEQRVYALVTIHADQTESHVPTAEGEVSAISDPETYQISPAITLATAPATPPDRAEPSEWLTSVERLRRRSFTIAVPVPQYDPYAADGGHGLVGWGASPAPQH